MYVIIIKLLDSLFRGLFVLVCAYRLPLEEVGKFGLMATMIGLLSFGLGYERQIDMQRQVAGRSLSAIRYHMANNLLFFRAHYLFFLALSILSATLFGFSVSYISLVTIVVIGEHVSNCAYHVGMLNPRAFLLLMAAAIKNSLQLLTVLYLFWHEPEVLTSYSILQVWAIVSVGYIAIAVIWWLQFRRERLPNQGDELPAQTLSEQYRASTFHFMVGLVAVAALQVDRLVAGGALSLTDTGIYFRNIVFAGLALQIFNIASFNRVMPRVYHHARESKYNLAQKIIYKEWRRFAIVLFLFVVSALAIDSYLGNLLARWGVHASYVVVLTASIIFRSRADYSGLLLLSMGKDYSVFINQSAATLLGNFFMFTLAIQVGLFGAFIGSCCTQLFYMLFNWRCLQASRTTVGIDNS